MDWKAELLKRLDALADKLGTTAAHLWSVLVRQAMLSGAIDFTIGLLMLTLTALGIWISTMTVITAIGKIKN